MIILNGKYGLRDLVDRTRDLFMDHGDIEVNARIEMPVSCPKCHEGCAMFSKGIVMCGNPKCKKYCEPWNVKKQKPLKKGK